MWSIALLINTSMWDDFKHNWQLVCVVFLQLHRGEEYINRKHRDTLLYKIRKIRSDPNTVDAIKSSDNVRDDNGELSNSDLYDFYDEEEDDVVEPRGFSSRSTREKVRKLNKRSSEFLTKR
jgi:hypothetical protein